MSFLSEITRFTRNERLGLAALSLLIAVLSCGIVFSEYIPLFQSDNRIVLSKSDSLAAVLNAEKREAERRDSIAQQRRYDSLRAAKYKKRREGVARSDREQFSFNPNRLSRDSFLLLGFKPYVADNIEKYRKAGGYFATPGDLKNIYDIDTALVEELAGFIKMPSESKEQPEKLRGGFSHSKRTQKDEDSTIEKTYKREKTKVRSINLNKTDTADLRKIYGIGDYYAYLILNYREELGGYMSVSQIDEIRRFPDSLYEQVSDYFYVEEHFVPEKVNINTLSAYKMSQHPYMSNRVGIAIESYRRRNGKFKSVEMLNEQGLLPDVLYLKIAPYLTAEKEDINLKKDE